ncbi:class IV adenylate cyclase [Candidatus Berkelbacteria bacterium CG10_big_fil_rev_8_21_14_0_10_41_12]|uniref:Class IV adenylate cyclase n=1 Tax=Candidatus Berkelbacteria bacterium CG10_big_fil_rev_8_21_14_0_10_41_12 TaxID=1974513 RepID=A0A2M6WWW9_9BACT|nr:MAG: class IV adenylate cyclase [Candidatus Berkelbacteria bacterium CG10_big_fil_rev_8_21_14_0_10_41_12]
MYNTEIELKYKTINLPQIEKQLKGLGVKFIKEFRCVDSYFLITGNDGRQYLRVREKDGRSELNYHFVISHQETKEWETEVESAELTKEILRKIGHKDDVAVDKTRKIYKYKNSEISLDKVKKLGNFIEIESPSKKELCEIEKELGFTKQQRSDKMGYPDMIRGYLIGKE